jgi:hypothetical protein
MKGEVTPEVPPAPPPGMMIGAVLYIREDQQSTGWWIQPALSCYALCAAEMQLHAMVQNMIYPIEPQAQQVKPANGDIMAYLNNLKLRSKH